MEDEATKFWTKFEAETGEKVEAKAVGTWYERADDERGLWGLLVLTDKSFRFRHLPSENWILSLFKAHRTSSSSREIVDIVVPLGDLLSVEEPHRGFLTRLFGPAFPNFALSWREASLPDGVRRERFATDPSVDFLVRLRTRVGPRPAAG